MASEKFQQVMRQVIKDCPGAYMTDDILIVGCTEEHDWRLTKVIQRFAERGLTVNEEQCQIKTSSML